MTELLDRAARYIDDGIYEGPGANNPMDSTLHTVADDIAVCCAFSHVWALGTNEGLTVFDTSLAAFGPAAVGAISSWRPDAVENIVYTHGHVDHVGGTDAFLADAEARGNPRPTVIAHENAPVRFDRYDLTNGYNTVINARQFGSGGLPFPDEFVVPDRTFETSLTLDAGTTIELHHDRGETDDHAWAWVPEHRAIFSGDLLIWVFPNAGNPQKVQRYAADWAVALRKMAALEPELILPAHGLPIAGADRIATVLDNTASVLEFLVTETLQLMNAGARLDEIVHTVKVPERFDLPYLQPTYDEPEFVVRNIWRLYGGWYDGNPARLKPPSDASVAAEVTALAGGADALAARAKAVADTGDLRLACQLVEWAGAAAPDDAEVHAVRAEVYRQRRSEELSLMAKGIFGTTADDSARVAGG